MPPFGHTQASPRTLLTGEPSTAVTDATMNALGVTDNLLRALMRITSKITVLEN